MSLEARVRRTLEAFDAADLGADPGGRGVAAWVRQVAETNRRIDLTAARDDDELVDLMVADAAVLATRLPRGARVVDVGTGAGAPGLPLAILRDDLDVTLVEPLQKRVTFLRQVVGSVLAERPRRPAVVRGRGEEQVGKPFDVAISRATLAPPAWLALGAQLAPAGEVWVMLAQGDEPALAGWRAEPAVAYAWPLGGASRRAVRYVPG